MEDTICKECRYFIQHYGLCDGQLFRIFCGHCTFSRTKRKLPDAKACVHFAPGSADSAQYVSKSYLTKELLNHVLSLELLPEIREQE